MLNKCIVFVVTTLMLFLIGCTKPEDKIRGQWQINEIYKENVETTTESPSEVENLLSSWTFYRSGIVVMKYYLNKTVYQTSGTWSIDDENNLLTVSFSDRYSSLERTYTIDKFKTNELQVSFTDDDKTKWTIAFGLLYSFQDYDI